MKFEVGMTVRRVRNMLSVQDAALLKHAGDECKAGYVFTIVQLAPTGKHAIDAIGTVHKLQDLEQVIA